MLPSLQNFFWYFESPIETLNVLIYTVGLAMVVYIDPTYGWPLIPFNYIYEIFLADGVLDHNPKITGRITKFLAIGAFHLRHHKKPDCNYAQYITFWDKVFGTQKEQ
jgi:sterol desaturase/sphingolipid hydroxylase (fatty acid hydroxylase superfamily)